MFSVKSILCWHMLQVNKKNSDWVGMPDLVCSDDALNSQMVVDDFIGDWGVRRICRGCARGCESWGKGGERHMVWGGLGQGRG